MIEIYRELPAEQAPAYRELFRLLAEGQLPLVFNCSGGKDRTGLAAALVLSALTVPWDVIIEDYALSNETFNYRRRTSSHSHLTIRISPEVAQVIGGAHTSYLETAFSTISNSYGSVATYVREELGVTDAMLNQIRSNLLE